jgi:hypothetical protein
VSLLIYLLSTVKLKPLLKTRCIAAVFLKKWNLLRILEADRIVTIGPGVMNYGQL